MDPYPSQASPRSFQSLATGTFARQAIADARATFIKSFADSTVIRAYRTRGPWGTPMDIVERFFIAAAALGFLLIAAMALLG